MKRFITPITFRSILIIFIMMTNSKIYSQSPQLVYSTLIGGSGWDYGHAITVDEEGYAYISGQANSTNYPTTAGALDRTANGSSDILITKLNKEGSALVYSSYIGGTGRDDTRKVFVDKSDCVYLTGATASSNFPTTSNTLTGSGEGYFLKLDSTGSHLHYSSRWAGGEKLLVDSEGYVIIMGSTNSTSFPTTENAYSRTLAGGDDLYIAKIDITNNNIIFSTLLGGDADEWAASFALDGDNNIIIAGSTSSSNFPVTGNTFVDYTAGKSNVFVTKLKSDGTQLLYSTLIGGGDDEWSFDVICDDENNAYVTGVTKSSDFSVTTSALDTSYNGGEDVFLTKLSSDGSELIYSTYIGGSSKDGGRGVVVGENGKVYLTGCTKSTDFPVSDNAYDNSFNGAGTDEWAWGDPFLMVMNAGGTQIEYSTYLGGSTDEEAYGIAMDNRGDIYLCGVTSSSNFLTTEGAYDRTLSGSCNIYVTKFSFSTIDYFCQTPPGDSAVVFAPGIISLTNRLESRIAFSPDGNECYFQTYTPDYVSKIYYTKRVNNTWTEQVEASFSVNNNIGNPFLSADGYRLYFNTNDRTNSDIYMVERTSDGWGESQLLPEPVNSDSNESSFSETTDGVIYIDSKRSDGLGGDDIWYKHPSSDQAKNLGSTVNTIDFDSSPCIAQDGSYLIFGSERNGRQGLAHLYISFKTDNDGWTSPVDMNISGAQINTNDAHHSGPSISPDGKFLFFFRHYDMTTMDIYWVSTTVIDDIKKKVFGEGDYLGQTPPGNTPAVFAPGIISVEGIVEHSAPTFSPDGNEVFWQANKLDSQQNWIISCMTMRRVGNTWSAPEVTSYDYGPFFSPDGKRLYFESKGEGTDPKYIEKRGDSWSEPISIGIIPRFPEIKFAYNLSVASNGTLYFLGYAAGHWNNFGLYRTELINGEYAEPELLPPSINSPGNIRNWTPYIAPDESYLVFSSSRGTSIYDQGDLFLCFRQPDGSWTNPVSLGRPINSDKNERFPAVSPDGKYLFFTRSDDDYDEGVLWVSAAIIDSLRSHMTDIGEKNGNGIIKDFRLNQNYPNPFNPSTNISYQLPESCNVTLKIYNVLGREIKTLVDSFQNTGEHSVVWNGTSNSNSSVCSGMYFYCLETGITKLQKKMMLIR